MNRSEMDDSLIIVTADHAHTLSINGYPNRGQNIFGIAQPSKADGVPYTTLTYGTGGADGFQVKSFVHKVLIVSSLLYFVMIRLN